MDNYILGVTPIKIQVNEQQSKTIQEICFDNGITWESAGKKLIHTLKEYLYISNFITQGKTQRYFNLNSAQEIDAEEFINKYKGTTMQQQFTKADLKTGMILEDSEGQMAHVLLNTKDGDIVSGDYWLPLSTIPENLNDGNNANVYNITKVHQPLSNKDYSDLSSKRSSECLWEYKKRSLNRVEVHHAGSSNRTIYINRENPTIITIGCFKGTFQEAVNTILKEYESSKRAAKYIAKVSECFKLAEKEFKEG